MKVWSKGLGKTELLADCRYYEVAKDPDSDNVFIIGNITDPVNWEFRAILEPEDVPGFMKLVFNGCMLKLIFKNMHRYIIYLVNRRKYQDPSHENLEEKVASAYDRMMKGRSRPEHLKA
jgi:hypothetical protein